MNSQVMYVIGEPGAGKSTLVDHLVRGLPSAELTGAPFAVREYDCGVTEIGARRRAFPGTDGLSMAVQPKVIEWLRKYAPPLVLAEGDRLGNAKFFEAIVAMGYTLRLYAIVGPAAALQRRIRDAKLGRSQDELWVKGRQAKVVHLIEGWWPRQLTAGLPLADLERTIASHDENRVATALLDARYAAERSAFAEAGRLVSELQ